ncbi:hypothetical protein LTR17_002253 [Elasticomyces elasticus]|nr:hypothetical protein LTR17_002253 [Elasticomyces elasticus]
MPVTILQIQPGSDGGGRRRPKTEGTHTRNDTYWLQRLGEEYAKMQGLSRTAGITYQLDRLPDGYGGWEKPRGAAGGDSKHVDRYMYGHPKGIARSIPDILPHFKALMNGNVLTCACKLCAGGWRSSGVGLATGGSQRSVSPTSSQHFVQPKALKAPKAPKAQVSAPKLAGVPQKPQPMSDIDMAPPMRRKQVDGEGVPDAIRALLDKLKDEGVDGKVDEAIFEHLSPDWRTGHTALMKTLREWADLPTYEPRVGELVLFVRHLHPHESLAWDKSAQTWRVLDTTTNSWVSSKAPKWEAGVVTQMPTEAITDEDLAGVPESKTNSVTSAGFRVEPLPKVRSMTKSLTRQHKYVPLHALRPLALWKDCLNGVAEVDYHQTIGHALSVASGVCILGRYHFKGTWPEATIFAQGMYLGAESVVVGDVVRLQNKEPGSAYEKERVTDVMVVTAMKVRIVNLDEAGDDDYDEGRPYTTCTHVSGRLFTLDPARSFDGVGKVPISANSPTLPQGLAGIGTWYHVTDPAKVKARIEVPFTRIIGRCFGDAALEAWFTPPDNVAATASFQAVNSAPALKVNGVDTENISRGLAGTVEARDYSVKHDDRIDKDAGKTWFWADSRVEMLDVQEVNSVFVGQKDEQQRKSQMGEWKNALQVIDGRKAVHVVSKEVVRSDIVDAAAGAGPRMMVDMSAVENSIGQEEDDDEDAMDVDEQLNTELRGTAPSAGPMDVDEEEDEEDASAALAMFKAKPNAKTMTEVREVVDLDSDSDMP